MQVAIAIVGGFALVGFFFIAYGAVKGTEELGIIAWVLTACLSITLFVLALAK